MDNDELPVKFRSKKKKLPRPITVEVKYRNDWGSFGSRGWQDYSKHRTKEDAEKYIDKNMREFSALMQMRIKNDKTNN